MKLWRQNQERPSPEEGRKPEKREILVQQIKKHKDDLYLLVVIVACYTVMDLVGIGCPIKFVTGISCAGCGMTRAWLSVLQLDFSTAWYYHPLFPIPPLAVIVYLFKSKINRNVYKLIMLTMAAAFIILYVYRLVNEEGDVVVFQPENNIVFRILKAV